MLGTDRQVDNGLILTKVSLSVVVELGDIKLFSQEPVLLSYRDRLRVESRSR